MSQSEQLTFLAAGCEAERLETISALLGDLHYHNCLQALDGTEAWALFKNFKVDFVICDDNIPELNGMTFLKLIRSQEAYADTPFVLIADGVTAAFVNQAGKAGVNDLVVLPLDEEIFKNKIQSIVNMEFELAQGDAAKQLNLGQDLMKNGKYEEALHAFQNVLTVHQNAEVHFNIGYIKSSQEKYDEALRHFRMATRINNDYAKAYKFMADIYQKLEKPEQAGLCLQEAADIYLERKQDTEAGRIYEEVLKIKPNTINVFNALGIIYRRQGRHEEAVEQYKKALKVSPDDDHIQYNLTKVLLELNRFEEAEAVIRRAVELNPEFAPSQELLRTVEMGLKPM